MDSNKFNDHDVGCFLKVRTWSSSRVFKSRKKLALPSCLARLFI